MKEWFGYLMLRGREGTAGYLRGQGERAQLSVRHAHPNTEYQWFSEDGMPETMHSDAQGMICQTVEGAANGFLACGGQVILWPEGKDQALFYYHAQQRLADARALNAKSDTQQNEPMGQSAPGDESAKNVDMLLYPAAQAERNEGAETGTAAAAETPHDAAAPAAETAPEAQEKEWEEPPVIASPSLRLPSETEAAFFLPRLSWPGEISSWKPYFEEAVSMAPFDAPNWRYVKGPSALPGIPYCLLGLQIQGQGIRAAAYAVPGSAASAPSALAGARFERGRDREGYWVVRRVF